MLHNPNVVVMLGGAPLTREIARVVVPMNALIMPGRQLGRRLGWLE